MMQETQEMQEIRTLARDFAAAELRPHSEHWDAGRALDADVTDKLAELGFFGMLIPEADGGMGFDTATYAAALEELAWGEPAVAVLVAHHAIAADLIARHLRGAARDELLAGLASGERIACIALADDPDRAPPTRAERDGAGWRIRGHKPWVSNGDRADVIVLLAGADDGDLLCAVPRGAGETAAPRAATLGLRALGLVDLEFDLRIDGDAPATLLQPAALEADSLGRISVAAIATGIAQAALEHAIRYGGEREQFGSPIRDFEGIQHKLAEMATRTAAARALVARAAADPADDVAAAMAKLAAAQCAMFVSTEAVQIFGGYGYMRDYPVEKLMRDAKATEIMHGPSEVQRIRIAQSLHA
jgi:alkylation response protein AidB-like acyl-CoA dehydrogenase